MKSEISQTEKDKHRMISLICGLEETKQTTMKTDSQIQRRNMWLPKGKGMMSGDNQVQGVKGYKHPVIK